MRHLLSFVLVGAALAALLTTPACESSDAGECCPVSEAFSCSSFDVGGARSLQPSGTCQTGIPDAFPVKKTRSVDAKGCPYWEPDPSATGRCGQAHPVDSGLDASSDSASDASPVDASDASDATPE
jgi:hypothetical protein